MADQPNTRPEESQEVFQELWQDYAETGPEQGTRWSDPQQFGSIFGLVERWLASRDPQFMDQAVLMCDHEKLPILPSLLRHVADAARLRRSKAGSKLSRADKESNKHRALRIVANLKACGITLTRACEVAAIWTTDHGIKAIKASTLEAEYGRAEWTNLEGALRAEYDSGDDDFARFRTAWLEGEGAARPITPEEKGERR